MKDGLDTQLGRWFLAGVELSGGQWQKVALARAFMREDADILILDEPTAALDAEAEKAVFERFRRLAKDRTSLLISHRFPTVRMADRIVVIEQGKIIEQGKEVNDLKATSEKNDQFLSILDKALVKQPQLAEQLKAALAEAMKASDAEPKDEPDIEAILDKKLEERETKAKTKAEIDKWIGDHEDFKDPKVGHQILDIIEKEKLPFNARTLQLAYDSITKDSQAKKAADEALKKEEVKNLERENASGVGGGTPATKGNTPQDNPFDDLVGSSINPNKVR
jgi:ABC-type multidrug transport system ATPase subunit